MRKNTFELKTEPALEEVFAERKKIYPDFKPFKVCFAIGIKNTGETVSNNFVLIGPEVIKSTGGMDAATSETKFKR